MWRECDGDVAERISMPLSPLFNKVCTLRHWLRHLHGHGPRTLPQLWRAVGSGLFMSTLLSVLPKRLSLNTWFSKSVHCNCASSLGDQRGHSGCGIKSPTTGNRAKLGIVGMVSRSKSTGTISANQRVRRLGHMVCKSKTPWMTRKPRKAAYSAMHFWAYGSWSASWTHSRRQPHDSRKNEAWSSAGKVQLRASWCFSCRPCLDRGWHGNPAMNRAWHPASYCTTWTRKSKSTLSTRSQQTKESWLSRKASTASWDESKAVRVWTRSSLHASLKPPMPQQASWANIQSSTFEGLFPTGGNLGLHWISRAVPLRSPVTCAP